MDVVLIIELPGSGYFSNFLQKQTAPGICIHRRYSKIGYGQTVTVEHLPSESHETVFQGNDLFQNARYYTSYVPSVRSIKLPKTPSVIAKISPALEMCGSTRVAATPDEVANKMGRKVFMKTNIRSLDKNKTINE